MNIVNNNATGAVQELRIEIVKEDYFEKIEADLKKQRRNANIPGFRQGNAPAGMIRKMYYKPLLADEINNMVGKALYDYLGENKLDIILEPIPVEEKTNVDFDNNENFEFTFEYALKPQFTLDFKKMPKVEAFKIEASKEEIDEYITRLQKRHGQYTSPENIEFEDDFISVKYGEDKNGYFNSNELNKEGQKLFKDKKVNDTLEVSFRDILENNSFLARFLKIEEKDIDANDTYTYTITINSIGRVIPAEINEEFFQKAFPNGRVNNEQEMVVAISTEIENAWREETDKFFMDKAITTLMDNATIELPDDFIKRYLLTTQQNMTSETLNAEYDNIQKSFKWQLIENFLVKEYSLSVDESEVKAYIRNFFITNYFSQFNQEDIEERLDTLVDDSFKNKKDIKQIYDTLFDKKVKEVLQSNMNLDEKSGDFKDFMAFVSGEKVEDKPKAKKKAAPKKAEEATDEKEATAPKTTKKKTAKEKE